MYKMWVNKKNILNFKFQVKASQETRLKTSSDMGSDTRSLISGFEKKMKYLSNNINPMLNVKQTPYLVNYRSKCKYSSSK